MNHPLVPVIQADRDAATEFGLRLANALTQAGYVGIYFESDDTGGMVQAFARHRINTAHQTYDRITELEAAFGKIAPFSDWLPHPDCVTMDDTIRALFPVTTPVAMPSIDDMLRDHDAD